MATRIREVDTLTELKELQLRVPTRITQIVILCIENVFQPQVMELETQVQVSTNQLRRQDEEGKRVTESLETALTREKEMANKAREQQHRYIVCT